MTKPFLEFDASRPPALARDAATVIVVRDSATGDGPEIFCVERNKKSRFLGGAIVFPGGKLEETDGGSQWNALTTRPGKSRDDFAAHPELMNALCVAALRETLEEAALLFLTTPVSNDEVLALRSRLLVDPTSLAAFLKQKNALLDTCKLHPLARWITPEAETRRFDTRFFLAVAPDGQSGAHDMQETMGSFWARARDVIERFDRREIQLAPPTHRTLEILAHAKTASEMIAIAQSSSLLPICPRLIAQEGTIALALPGDPDHDIREPHVSGRSRYVLRDGYWLSEDANGG